MELKTLSNSNTKDFQQVKISTNQLQSDLKIDQNKVEVEKISKEMLEKTIESINKFLTPTVTNLSFKIHDKSHEYYVQVVDSSTNEVIKEIPSRKMLDIHYEMKKYLGLLVDEKI